VSDATTGGAEVRNAEFFIDMIGISGTGQTMRPADGAYNSTAENMVVDINGLSAGPHTIHVHGRDVFGNWGPFVALNVNSEPGGSGGILYRINTGGSQLPGNPVWAEDTSANPSPFVNLGSGNSRAASVTTAINMSHPSIPPGTPMEVFQSERFDPAGGGEMQWNFSVPPGEYEVRLYFAETWSGAQTAGARVFDVQIEGATLLDNYDVFADVGGNTGVVKSFTVTADANLDIDFFHVVQNPSIKGIEIIDASVEAGLLVASTTSLDFGTVEVNDSVPLTLTLTNGGAAGSSDITIDPNQAVLTPSDVPYHVVFADTEPIVLAPGESTLVTVTYSPTTPATHQATLSILHSAVNSPINVSLTGVAAGEVPINFTKSILAEAPLHRPTKLQFGPDGRLYVSQQNGLIRIYTVVRDGPNSFRVASQQQVTLIQDMPNHDDDGVLNPTVANRLVTGMLVTGTAQNPVIYVASSDPRIAGGTMHEDLNLDTNSGILSRLTWNGSSWVKHDLVRGLPRSEENHASNGMALDAANNILYIAQGGNTNMGAPSANFTFLPEYALSAAILSVDLDMIGETTYDLPTLNDEDRAGTSDFNDPFGGNNGQNQAILVPGGPVQVHSPGYRNPYDVHITTAGRMYTVDNGSNAGWGGMPIGEGPGGNATNQPNEANSFTIEDQLHFIPGPGYYGGHPNPTRANTNNTFNTSIPQSPVALVGGNPIESDYLLPPGEDGSLFTVPASTNGLDEYTTATFGGQMQGDLIIASFDNTVKRIKLNAAGNAVVFAENLFSNVGTVPLDVDVADSGPWAGSIWVCDINTSTIYVFEPAAGGGGNPNDFDGDGYTNDDEIANGTNPNNAADVPADFDMDFTSNLNDPNDDNDSLLDNADRFAVDPDNGSTTPVGTLFHWENEGEDEGGLLDLGFTGLMTNGVDNYQSLFDPSALTAGGAAGVFTIDSATAGTARGATNTQEQAFQIGVHVADETTPFTASTSVLAPFGALTPQAGQEMGLYIGTGDQDNFVQIVLSGNNGGSVQVMTEFGGIFTTVASQSLPLPGPGFVDLHLTVDPVANTVQAKYLAENDQLVNLGGPIAIPAAWLDGSLAAGLIATDPTASGTLPVTWDYLGVESGAPASGTAEAFVLIQPPTGGMLTASTAAVGSFRIVNNSVGDVRIETVTINSSAAVLPDLVFDPNGTGGDTGVGPPFSADSGSIETGFASHSFGGSHDGGFDSLTIQFNDFNPGESFTFHIDVDPTSIKGAAPPGPSGTGHVSGLELTGSLVTIVFSDGTTTQTRTFRTPGNQKGSQTTARTNVPPTPGLELVGSTAPAIVSNPNQTLRITGPAGSSARLIHIEASLHLAGVPGGGFDIDPFEANKATKLTEFVVTIGGAGFVDVPVVLTSSEPEGGYNYFVAVLQGANGLTGGLSPKVALKLQTGAPSSNLSIFATSANNPEGHTGTTAFTFTVTRSGDTSGTTTVNYAVNGSGTSPANAADFGGSLPSGLVTFTAGQTSQPISVNVSGDTDFEPHETFNVTLSDPSGGAQIVTALATGTILNDDVQLGENGLLGEYFNTVTLTSPAGTRVDATVNFPQDWGSAPPGTAVAPDDRFSVRWTGFVETSPGGSWTFYTTSNDGVRLWIDDMLVIDNWTTHAVTENSATVSLTSGWHAIRLEYFQQAGIAEMTLAFQGPGQPKAIIPQAKLRTTDPSGQLALSPLPGDYNHDRVVDQEDYGVWKRTYGVSGLGLDADGNRDGNVDVADYALWRFNFQEGIDDGAPISFAARLEDAQVAAAPADYRLADAIDDEVPSVFPSVPDVPPGSLIQPVVGKLNRLAPRQRLQNFIEAQSRGRDLLMARQHVHELIRDWAFTVQDFPAAVPTPDTGDLNDDVWALAFELFDDGGGAFNN
jgi:hypothetical protein